MLPVQKETFGYVQRSYYSQPDLYHEEVLDIESPFASVVASGTLVYTFLVLGDQNAGKSTFLSAFSDNSNSGFLRVTSYLPILSSCFVNTRFFEGIRASSLTDPIDELPFLDTDLARASFLLTRDDFAFFVNDMDDIMEELGSPIDPELMEKQKLKILKELPDDTRYVVIQFIEVGGDHLDHLATASKKDLSGDPLMGQEEKIMVDILRKSDSLLRSAQHTLFFLNASTLLGVVQDPSRGGHTVRFAEDGLRCVVRRLDYLGRVLPARHEMLFYVSRLSSDVEKSWDDTAARHEVARVLQALDLPEGGREAVLRGLSAFKCEGDSESGHGGVGEALSPVETELGADSAVCAFLRNLLRILGKLRKWSFHIADVCVARHVRSTHAPLPPDGATGGDTTRVTTGVAERTTYNLREAGLGALAARLDLNAYMKPQLDYGEVMKTVVRCFLREMVLQRQEPEEAVARELLKCFKAFNSPGCSSPTWISQGMFHDFLFEADHGEVPEMTALQRFLPVSDKLACLGMCMVQHRCMSLRQSIQFIENGRVIAENVSSVPSLTLAPVREGALLRFPCHAGLLQIMETFLERNVPGEFWLREQPGVALEGDGGYAVSELKATCDQLSSAFVSGWASLFTHPPTALRATNPDRDRDRTQANTDDTNRTHRPHHPQKSPGSPPSSSASSSSLLSSSVLHLISLLEDWCLAQRMLQILLRPKADCHPTSDTTLNSVDLLLQFPLELSTPEDSRAAVQNLLREFVARTEEVASTSEASSSATTCTSERTCTGLSRSDAHTSASGSGEGTCVNGEMSIVVGDGRGGIHGAQSIRLRCPATQCTVRVRFEG
eukprot:Rmarinus@m.29798